MGLQLVGAIVLARLLNPDAYGLIAMVTVLMGLGALIRDFGMGTASLQERDLSNSQASNLFWVSAALSVGSALLLGLAAPIVAAMFGDDRLTGLVPVMAVVLLLTGLQTQHQMRLARQMRFTAMVVASVTSILVGILVGIAGALLGLGYWALAMQQGATALWMVVALLVLTRWIPSLPVRGAGSRKHVHAGAEYGLANMLGYAADNADTLMIGIRFDAIALGNYNRAFQLFMQPITGVFGPLIRVVVPTVNRATASGGDPHRMLLRVQSSLVGLATWALLVTAAVADWLIPLLLGDQWNALVPLLQILALGGVFKALSQINYWAYVISKQSRQLFYSNLVTKPIQISLVVIAAFFGVEWVAWAYVAGRAISWPINLVWLARTAGQPPTAALINGLRILVAAVVAYAVTRILLGLMPAMTDFSMTLSGVLMASVLFFAAFLASPGGAKETKRILTLANAFRST
ncbi:lipopolysaccharide biosynthesis protein [Nesterenkonia sp. E16_10]|nr:lipopolysaccharide biosynthesis protein [Nesterenkonia sp. E16_10]